MTKSEKRWATVIGVIVVAFIIWLLLRKNPAFNKFVTQNVPWLQPLVEQLPGLGGGPGSTYNISSPGYVPANMPIAGGTSKCDSNKPCTFCTVPMATFPSKPVTYTAPPISTVYAQVNPFNQQQPAQVNWAGQYTVGGQVLNGGLYGNFSAAQMAAISGATYVQHSGNV